MKVINYLKKAIVVIFQIIETILTYENLDYKDGTDYRIKKMY